MVSPPPWPPRGPRDRCPQILRSLQQRSLFLETLPASVSQMGSEHTRARTRAHVGRASLNHFVFPLPARVKVAEEIPADRVGVRLARRGRGRYRVNSTECTADTPGSSFLFKAGCMKGISRGGGGLVG